MSPANPQPTPPARPTVGDSIEGFRHTADPTINGMKNLDKAEGFGSQFQMPEAQTNDAYLEAPSKNPDAAQPFAGFADFDLHQRLEALNDLAHRLKAALSTPEQDELESILREGTELITATWKAISGGASQSFQSLKGELKDNPYQAIMTALRIGIALSQMVSHRSAGALPASSAVDAGQPGPGVVLN